MNSEPNKVSDTTAVPPPLATGQKLKHFQLQGLLGQGGMGMVYRAYDSRLHRPVAVKVLSHDLTADPARKQRFLQEARAAARISHPAIAQIFDADEAEGITFIVMELVEGKTVHQLIANQELDLLGAMDIAIHVTEGLAKAHGLGIVHRDIKPANVMRTVDGHVKILDFGLAKLLGWNTTVGPEGAQGLATTQMEPTRSSIVMGTPAYMSPEQVRGLPVDARTDIFAVGVLLFEMATGQSPFQRPHAMAALHAAGYEEAPPMSSIRPHIPEDLQRIVTRCLKKQPDERYPDARLLGEELRHARRATETGLPQKTSWQQYLVNKWAELKALPPSQYRWYAIGLVGVAVALYFSVAKIGTGGLVFLSLVGLYIYRRVRNAPDRALEQFVRKVSKIPEVRLVIHQEQQIKVFVDQPAAQLYERINAELRNCNRKLFFGPPLTLSIQHLLPAEQSRTLLAGPGVQYVRPDVIEPGKTVRL